MSDDASQPLILSASAQLMAASGAGEELVIHAAPRWLCEAMGWPTDFPREPQGEDFAPLAALLRDLIATGQPVRELVLELRTPAGDLISVLVQGRVERDLSSWLPGVPGEAGALLALRDVSALMRERRKVAAIGTFHGLVGRSVPMLEVYQKIAVYGPTEAPVIITGETGTGKELVARSLHDRSPRAQGPFVAVNCVALTAELFESELFGHEKGSFTGAMRQHKGRFQRADTGTLFLDEIGDMPMMTQAKMLRALEEGIVERVGSEREEKVDVRVVAATNVALEQAVAARRFRIDLFHRLSVLRIHMPALRDRRGDLPLIVEHFLSIFNRRYGKNILRVTPEALKLLEQYHWPGNIRELRNVLERLVIETAGDAIGARALGPWIEEREYMQPGNWNADHLYEPREPIIAPAHPMQAADSFASMPRHGGQFWGAPAANHSRPVQRSLPWTPADQVIEAEVLPREEPAPTAPELTEETIREAYRRSRGNLTAVARSFGIHKATLYRHMKQLGIDRNSLKE
jgi:DNA-binding NtrC family response regulator